MVQFLKVILIYFFYMQIRNVSTIQTYDTYLNEKLTNFKTELQQTFKNYHNSCSNISATFANQPELIQNEKYIFTVENTGFFHKFNSEVYLMKKGALFKPIVFQHQIFLEFSSTVDNTDTISFIESTVYRNEIILLVAFTKGYSRVYKSNNLQSWKYQQTIQNFGVAMGATFFEAHSTLYCFIINQKGEEMSPSILYKWQSTYFDEYDRILTISANRIISFEHKRIVIIVLTQNSPSFPQIGSRVFHFDNSKLIHKQYLKTNGPHTLYHFRVPNVDYIFISNSFSKSVVYRVTDFDELIEYSILNETHPNIYTFSYKDYQFFVVPSETDLILYQMAVNTFRKIGILISNVKNIQAVSVQVAKDEIQLFLLTKVQYHFEIWIQQFKINTKVTKLCSSMALLIQKVKNLEANQRSNLEIVRSFLQNENISMLKPKTKIKSFAQITNPNAISLSNFEIKQNLTNAIKNKILSIENKLSTLEAIELINITDPKVLGKFIITGNVAVKLMKTHELHTAKINNHFWEPNNWLTQEKTQIITGTVHVQKIIANSLFINPEKTTIFTDLLWTRGNSIMSGSVTFKNLYAQNIQIKRINNIPFRNIVTKMTTEIIKGTKTFQNLNVVNLQVPNWNKLNIENTPEKLKVGNVFISSDLEVDDIEVSNINKINFNNLVKNLFLKNNDFELFGNLSFVEQFRTNRLNTDAISNVPVNKLLTRTTDQNVTTNIFFRSINARNIDCTTINGVSLSKDAAKTGEPIRILGPVSILNFEAKGDLTLKGEIENSTWFNIQNHIVGTHESDLLQIYTETVQITGNLILKDIHFTNFTTVKVNNEIWTTDFGKIYWLKNTNQRIDHSIAFKRGLRTPNLWVRTINTIPVQHFVNNTPTYIWPILPTNFYFENVKVFGNVTTFRQNFNTFFQTQNIMKMDQSAIKLTGNFKITDTKIFKDKIYIKNLYVDSINEHVIRNSNKLKAKNVQIYGDVIVENKAHIHVKKLYNDKFFEQNNLKRINLETLKASNITVENLNGHEINRIFDFLNKKLPLNRYTINGNVKFENLVVKNINKFSTDRFSKIVQKENYAKVRGKKSFKMLKVVNLNSIAINGIKKEDILNGLLSRTRPQTITGKFTFNNVKTPYLKANIIDGIHTRNLLSRSAQKPQIINTTLRAKSAFVNGTVRANLLHGNSIESIKEALKTLNNKNFNQLTVKGNLTVPSNSTLLKHFRNIVFSNQEINITGTVRFKNPVIIKNLYTNKKLINNTDLELIRSDALFRNRDNQVISGKKLFRRNVHAQYVNTNKNPNISLVNGLNIVNFDRTVVRYDQNQIKITGQKVFHSPIYIEKLQIPNRIHNVLPYHLVTTEDKKALPVTTFENLTVLNNFYLENVNGKNFTEFLKTLVFQSGNRTQHIWRPMHFENLLLSGNAFISTINNVNLSNVVVDSGTKTQKIESPVTFVQPLKINGMVNIDELNNIDIKQAYENALFVDEDAEIFGNIVFDTPVNIDSKITTPSLNHFKFDELQNNSKFEFVPPEIIPELKAKIERGVRLAERMASRYLYLEHMYNMPIPKFEITSIQNSNIHDTFLFNLMGHVPGNECNMTGNCKCSVQFTFQMTPSGNVDNVHALSFERTYTFNDANVVLNIVTNTQSFNETCKSNTPENESTQIVWFEPLNLRSRDSHKANELFSFHPDHIPGYLSDVKHFVSNNQTYVVLARYYDPIGDSHQMDCLILKISNEHNTTQLLQTIPTFGAIVLNLFHSPQGIMLIIGNTYKSVADQNEINSGIYRFDTEKEWFDLLRNVPSKDGILTLASGTLQNDESVIAFGQRSPILIILKYDKHFDNFYYYQSIIFETEVVSINMFDLGENSNRDVFLSVLTKDGKFSLYKYKYIEGFGLVSESELPDVKRLFSWSIKSHIYIIAPTDQGHVRFYQLVKNG